MLALTFRARAPLLRIGHVAARGETDRATQGKQERSWRARPRRLPWFHRIALVTAASPSSLARRCHTSANMSPRETYAERHQTGAHTRLRNVSAHMRPPVVHHGHGSGHGEALNSARRHGAAADRGPSGRVRQPITRARDGSVVAPPREKSRSRRANAASDAGDGEPRCRMCATTTSSSAAGTVCRHERERCRVPAAQGMKLLNRASTHA